MGFKVYFFGKIEYVLFQNSSIFIIDCVNEG